MLKKLCWMLFSLKGRMNRKSYFLSTLIIAGLLYVLFYSGLLPGKISLMGMGPIVFICCATTAKRANDTKDAPTLDFFTARYPGWFTDPSDPNDNKHGKPYAGFFPPDEPQYS